MAKRGRPFKSEIRNNIITILFYLGEGYGYEVSKLYNKIFPKVTMRSIYYHLKRGVELGEIQMKEIKQEQGNYSWGTVVEKTYYSLGKNAHPATNDQVMHAVTEHQQKRK